MVGPGNKFNVLGFEAETVDYQSHSKSQVRTKLM